MLTTPPHETPCYEIFTRRDASSGDETKQSGSKLLLHLDLRGGVFLEEAPRGRQRKRDIVLVMWYVRSLYRAGSLTAVARELARYKLDLVGVQEVRWDKWGTVRAGDYNFFYGKGHGVSK